MKLNKFSKVLYTIASLCCLCVGSGNAIKQEILDARKNVSDAQMPQGCKQIANGQYGAICTLVDDDSKLLKRLSTLYLRNDKINEMDMATLLASNNNVPPYLMKVYQVAKPNQDTMWYTFEKINGCSVKDYIKGIKTKKKGKIPWDVFCRDWAVGLFEGMKYVQDALGTQKIYNSFNKKDEDCFFVLGDRNSSNIMVRDDKTPVHIDYGFINNFSISNNLKKPSENIIKIRDILLNILTNKGVKVPKAERDRRYQLKKYLKSIENMPMKIDLLDNIIEDIKKITGII